VSRSTLRIWEDEGLIRPVRTQSGYRTYSPEQVERLKQIQRLRNEKNLNIAAIRHLIDAEPGEAGDSAEPGTSHPIGEQLRGLHEKRQLTILEVAERTGLSHGYLSSLERGQSNASVATLQKLSVFYQTNILAFFSDSRQPRKLVRFQNRKHIPNEPGIDIELLASGSNLMEPHLFCLAPARRAAAPITIQARSLYLY